MTKDSFIFHFDFIDEEEFSVEEIGLLTLAMISYERDGVEPKFEDRSLRVAWNHIKNRMDNDACAYEERCETNRINGRKGGRPKREISTLSGRVVPEAGDGIHFLYFLSDITTGFVKVGETIDLKNRIYTIKKPTNDLVLIEYIVDEPSSCKDSEKEILKKYKEYSVGGDWFDMPQPVIDEIVSEWFVKKPIGFSKNQTVSKKPHIISSHINSSHIRSNDKSEQEVVEVYSDNKDLDQTIHEFIDNRKALKKPMTGLAIRKMLNKLDSLADSDSEKIEILNNSIANGWQGVFPLDKRKPKSQIDWSAI